MPNILILCTDQHRWDALGCTAHRSWLGEANIRTPNIDRLASTGMLFDQAVCNYPVCLPSRHSFITGVYPHQLGTVRYNESYWPDELPVPTLGQYLEGYDAAAYGKMHWKPPYAAAIHVSDRRGFMHRNSPNDPLREGPVDESYADWLSSDEAVLVAAERPADMREGEDRVGYAGWVTRLPAKRLPEGYLTDWAVEHLTNLQEDPFCIIWSVNRPHAPGVIPVEYDGLYDPKNMPLPPSIPEYFVEEDPFCNDQGARRRYRESTPEELQLALARYLTNVTLVDDCVGRILAALEQSGRANDTLVIFMSDHGDLMGERAGMRTKYNLYDSSIRVPFILRWPGMQGGQVSSALIELVDLVPTCLDYAGIPVPPWLVGRSVRPLLDGVVPNALHWREATFTEFNDYLDWTIREPHYKLIERSRGYSALYDLKADPHELRNLIDNPALFKVQARLRHRLLQRAMESAAAYPGCWLEHYDTMRIRLDKSMRSDNENPRY